jgi:DNA-binding MarR family transcriptional regulator
MATVLRSLLDQELIFKSMNPADSRSDLIHCTKRGLRLVTKVENTALKSLSRLSSLSLREVELVERFIRGAALDFFLYQRNFRVTPILESQELQRARRLMVVEMSSAEYSTPLPSTLFSEANTCIGLYQSSELVAAVELQEGEGNLEKRYTLVNLYLTRGLHPDTVRAFIAKGLNSGLTSSLDVEVGEYRDMLRPSATVSSTLGALFRLD